MDTVRSCDRSALFTPRLQKQVGERFLHLKRDAFCGERIYLESAGGSLTLESAMNVTNELGGLPHNSGRMNMGSRFMGQMVKAGRKDVATFLNANGGIVVAGESTTANVFRIFDAITSGRRQGNIVCTASDHACTISAAQFFARRYQLDFRCASIDPLTSSVSVDSVEEAVTDDTILVSIIHASNITGAKNDISEIVSAIRNKAPDAAIVIDGAQHAQHGVIDFDSLGVDAYVFSPYKVFSRPGCAFAYFGPRILDSDHMKLAGLSNECLDLGTRDVSAYAAFSAVVDYLSWLGESIDPRLHGASRRRRVVAAMEGIEAHERALTKRLFEGSSGVVGLAEMPGLKIVGTPHADEVREAVVAFQVEGLGVAEFIRRCEDRKIIIHDRCDDHYSGHTLRALNADSVVRVSFAHYNNLDDVDAFLAATADILGANK